MKTITMVELRTDSERVVRELKQGQRFELTYRGEKIADLVPPAPAASKRAQDALRRLRARHADNPDHARQVDLHIAEVYEDRSAYGERLPG